MNPTGVFFKENSHVSWEFVTVLLRLFWLEKYRRNMVPGPGYGTISMVGLEPGHKARTSDRIVYHKLRKEACEDGATGSAPHQRIEWISLG